MKAVFTNIIFRNPSNKIYWLFIALLGRTVYCILENHFMGVVDAPKGVWGVYYDETYFAGIDNLIKTGNYIPDERMPGLGLIYLPLILLFSKVTALNILILLQVAISSVSLYVLALTARRIFKNDFVFYGTFYLFLISAFTAISDSSPASESFCTSMLIFAVYYYVLALEGFKKAHFILSGIFITWVCFIRPVYFPLCCVFGILIAFYVLRNKRSLLTSLFLFVLPFTVAEGTWIARNYLRYHKIMPTLKTMYLSQCENSYRFQVWKFEQAWGKEEWGVDWLTEKDTTDITKEKVPFPSYIYTSKYNEDSLKAFKIFLNKAFVRQTIKKDSGTVFIDTMSAGNLQIVKDKCSVYTLSLKKEKPFIYYVWARCVILSRFFVLSLFGNFLEPYAAIICGIAYYTVIVAGFIGILLLAGYCFKLSYQAIIPLIPLYSVFIHPIVLRLSENRYFIPAYPFMLICAVYALYRVYCKIKKQDL